MSGPSKEDDPSSESAKIASNREASKGNYRILTAEISVSVPAVDEDAKAFDRANVSPHPQVAISTLVSLSSPALSGIDQEAEIPTASFVSILLEALSEIGKLGKQAEQAQSLSMMSEEELSERGLKRDEAVRSVFRKRFNFD